MLTPYDLGGKLPGLGGLTEVLGLVDAPAAPFVRAVRVHALEQDAVVITATFDVFAQAPLFVLRYVVSLHGVMRCSGGGRGLV